MEPTQLPDPEFLPVTPVPLPKNHSKAIVLTIMFVLCISAGVGIAYRHNDPALNVTVKPAAAAAPATTEPASDDTSVFDDPEIAVIALGATWEAQMPTICDNVRLALDNVDFEELYDVMSAAMFDSPSPIPRNTATEHKLRNLILACS